MEGVCKLAGRAEESTGSEETSGVPAAEQETGGVTGTSLSSRLHLQGGEAEKERTQESPPNLLPAGESTGGKAWGPSVLSQGA